MRSLAVHFHRSVGWSLQVDDVVLACACPSLLSLAARALKARLRMRRAYLMGWSPDGRPTMTTTYVERVESRN
jgi:hypothetical protein